MKENEHHEKDNTGMIIAIVIAVLLVVGLIAYFLMNDTNEVEDAIDNAGDAVENITDNDNDEKTAADVAGSYQATVNTTNEENTTDSDYIELVLDEDSSARLVITSISKDEIKGTFKINDKRITITDNNTDDNDATDTTNDNAVTETATDPDGDGEIETKMQNYDFTINDDDTLTYESDNQSVILQKVKNDTLKYIK